MAINLKASSSMVVLSLLASMSCGEQVVVRDAPAVCGNGQVDAEEQCDDGNTEARDECTEGCRFAICGDGIMRIDLEVGSEGFEGSLALAW